MRISEEISIRAGGPGSGRHQETNHFDEIFKLKTKARKLATYLSVVKNDKVVEEEYKKINTRLDELNKLTDLKGGGPGSGRT